MKNKTLSYLKLVRLAMGGALVGVAIGNLFGIHLPVSVPTDLITGAVGASFAGIAIKALHVL